jgi:hypothetical protein
MTFLELCRPPSIAASSRARTLMTTTVGQVGRKLKVVTASPGLEDDSDRAHRLGLDARRLQRRARHRPVELHAGAAWHRRPLPRVHARPRASTSRTPSTTRHRRADETPLCQISPRLAHDVRAGAQTNSRPCYYALEAGNNLLLGPAARQGLRAARPLHEGGAGPRADADVPELPDHFHDVIKWRAIIDCTGRTGPLPTARRPGRIFAALPHARNEQTAPVQPGRRARLMACRRATMAVESTPYAFGGGLDQASASLAVPGGRVIAGLNYEPVVNGYQRVQGHERFDGRLPSTMTRAASTIPPRRRRRSSSATSSPAHVGRDRLVLARLRGRHLDGTGALVDHEHRRRLRQWRGDHLRAALRA